VDGPSGQAAGPVRPEGGDPAPHRPGIDTEEVANFLGRVSFDNPLDRQLAAAFQFRR